MGCSKSIEADRLGHYLSKTIRTESGCLEWQGTLRNGYGRVGIKRKFYQVHRWIYEQTHGSIPEGYDLCHKCDNRKCVNPDHMFVGTRADNMNDMVKKGRGTFHKGEENHNYKGGIFINDLKAYYRQYRKKKKEEAIAVRSAN